MASSDFKDILAAVEHAVTPAAQELPAVGEAVQAFRGQLALVDNFGRTGDDRDLYHLLDGLTAAVSKAYPGSLCGAGCSGCCDSDTAVFDVKPDEWSLIEEHMATEWTPERRAGFLARFDQEHAPRLGAYRWLAAIRFFEPVADRYFAQKPYRCPFLENGRCSIYAARPLVCRMYGHFAARTRWYMRPSIYACSKQTAYFNQVRETEALHLPFANLVVTRFNRLSRGFARFLPLWVDRWRKTSARG